MKSYKNRKSQIGTLLMACFFLFLNSVLIAQETKSELNDFKISIEKLGNEIIMNCDGGCAWVNLAYENFKEAQAINDFGMTELNEDQTVKDKSLSKFLFTISKTKDGLSLKGLEGTAWIDLSFELNDGQKQLINQFGMVRGE